MGKANRQEYVELRIQYAAWLARRQESVGLQFEKSRDGIALVDAKCPE